ncbi:MAG: mechanosensitive ion channel family protein [Nitratireductor sp.]|nr:mechanosensitive ion channel family protein [Nitratireductor sp.]
MILTKAHSLWSYLMQPWSAYQLLLIVGCFVIAWFAAKYAEPRAEARVRNIKGNPGLLRMLSALLRRLEWLFFIPVIGLVLLVMQSVTWPSRSYLISIALQLATAWLVIAVLSRVIRTRTISRMVALVVWTIVALNITNLYTPIADTLDSVSFGMGKTRFSMLQVIQGILLIVSLLWIANFTGNFVQNRINRMEDLTPSLQVLIGKFVKIILIIVALTAALSGIGLDLTALTVFSGAVGVGLGFGLQKVVSNFISGVIILLDKSIKPGDTITLEDTFGWVRELRARFVSVITRDGKEYLIPNEDFITRQVVNWSFSDDLVRIDVSFGVSYDSDPHEVIRIAKEVAGGIDRISKVKPPVCWLVGFGDSSLDFVLRFWISDPRNGLTNIRGTVLIGLWDAFKEADIGIPFPHREIIMRTPVEITEPPARKPSTRSQARGK